MSCVCDCLWTRRRGYENLNRPPIEESTVRVKENGPLRKPNEDSAVKNKEAPEQLPRLIEESKGETEPLHRPIEESNFSSDSFTIGSKGLVFSRREESGYALQILEGSFQGEVAIKVDVYYPDSKPRFVPERSELVSGVCHVVSKEPELRRSGFLVIDHCMDIRNAEDRDSVSVVTHNGRRESDVSSGSYQFQYVDDSDIEVKSDRVGVTLRKLGSVYYAVVSERRGGVGYCGLLYREAVLLSCTKFYFMVVKDLFFYVKAVQERCAARKLEQAHEPVPVTFALVPDGQKMKLTLDLKKEGIRNKGWHIYPCTLPAEIFECDAHNYHPKHYYIPSIELQAVWEQPAPGPDTLVEFINIVGVKRPTSLALQHEPGRPYPPEIPGTNDPTVPKMSELIKCVGQKGKHNIPEEIGTNYFDFGAHLLDDKTGTIVNGIEWQYQKNSEAINREILRRWLEGRGKKPVQWATLIQVLKDISRRTLAEDIELGLMERDIGSF